MTQDQQLSTPEGAADEIEPDYWFVLVCGLHLEEDSFELGESVSIQRLREPLTLFDLASVGAVGFREWAVLEPLAASATAEFVSSTHAAKLPGYNALNKCWLASALLTLRGFSRHTCPAASSYSWNLVAGHQAATSSVFRRQLKEEGVHKAVYEPRASLSKFRGGLLDYHMKILLPSKTRREPFGREEAGWFAAHFGKFNALAAEDERFRFALEAAVDWRFSKDVRAAIARLWAGIEGLFSISSELVFRIALMASAVLAPRGSERLEVFNKVKGLYGVRSKAAHGEAISQARLNAAMDDSFDLLRRLLLDAVERGAVRQAEDYDREIFF